MLTGLCRGTQRRAGGGRDPLLWGEQRKEGQRDSQLDVRVSDVRVAGVKDSQKYEAGYWFQISGLS